MELLLITHLGWIHLNAVHVHFPRRVQEVEVGLCRCLSSEIKNMDISPHHAHSIHFVKCFEKSSTKMLSLCRRFESDLKLEMSNYHNIHVLLVMFHDLKIYLARLMGQQGHVAEVVASQIVIRKVSDFSCKWKLDGLFRMTDNIWLIVRWGSILFLICNIRYGWW